MAHLYLLHFRPRFRHAGHYLGVTNRDDVNDRIAEHLRGEGANIVRHAKRAGCEILLARTWLGVERKHELRLKGRSLLPLCPICKEEANGKGTREGEGVA